LEAGKFIRRRKDLQDLRRLLVGTLAHTSNQMKTDVRAHVWTYFFTERNLELLRAEREK